ncbi:hypothetical protein H0H92_001081 [Tricholoma furcatifolium]|nr:hypothetical protein H0H92_001081 [Tricholoma furcatifolium]
MATVASILVATSKTIYYVIGFRCLQATGTSAIITIGAATLADIFEPKERGTKMGIFYVAPLLGTSIGPILGGGLTTGFGWRAIFWFLCIVAGCYCVCFTIFFRDTFRKERSLTYQNLLRQRLEQLAHKKDSEELSEKNPGSDAEKGSTETSVKLRLRDVNPAKPIFMVMRRVNNMLILFASGLQFALGFFIPYASARTLSMRYNYNALMTGIILVAHGAGSVTGSVLGGRFSDRELARLKAANGNVGYPEGCGVNAGRLSFA